MWPLTDEIEALLEEDPKGSRTAVHAYAGDERGCASGFGHLGDPRDFDVLAAGLADPKPRFPALEALADQTDADRVDAVARFVADRLKKTSGRLAGLSTRVEPALRRLGRTRHASGGTRYNRGICIEVRVQFRSYLGVLGPAQGPFHVRTGTHGVGSAVPPGRSG
jgi:hypothetical protein